MNGQMSNINLDNVDIGVDVDETQPYVVHFSNLNIANAGAGTRHIGVWGHGNKAAEVTIRGASFWGQLNQAVLWDNPGTLSVGDSRVVEWNIRRQQPAMIFSKGKVILHDSFFSYRQKRVGVAVRALPGVERVLMHHNLVSPHTVENQAGGATLEEGEPVALPSTSCGRACRWRSRRASGNRRGVGWTPSGIGSFNRPPVFDVPGSGDLLHHVAAGMAELHKRLVELPGGDAEEGRGHGGLVDGGHAGRVEVIVIHQDHLQIRAAGEDVVD